MSTCAGIIPIYESLGMKALVPSCPCGDVDMGPNPSEHHAIFGYDEPSICTLDLMRNRKFFHKQFIFHYMIHGHA